MEIGYKPYVDPEVESLIARIHPPRICIDNDAFQDCTLVKVDSANKHGVLLEMVQVLTDLDLVISKSYISSDGGWLMDVFHVTDQLGNKIVDESIIHYIQQALCESRRGSREIQTFIGRDVRPRYVLTEHTALEMTGTDRPGLMSEISAVLAEMGCHISAAVAWTHNARAACIVYVEDDSKHGPITDPYRVAQIQAQLENVVEAHHYNGERRSVRLSDPTASRTHTERRLHQLMAADRDYEQCCPCRENGNEEGEKHSEERCYNSETSIKIENCKEKGYSIVTVWSRDRPKLLFDTVCALTDMQYVVFHASISSHDSTSVQEYYVRHKDGCTLNLESERRRVTQCLIAATERRASHGLRLDICTQNRLGLLSDVTRVFRENGLSITRAEIGTQGERAIGTFYVKDTSGQSVDPETLESVRQEIGGTVKVVHKSSGRFTQATSSGNSTRRSHRSSGEDGKAGFSLGSLLWAQLERLSNNFRPIKS
nr:ACT domain-containing protein ACR1 [Ipomoea batatas]